LPLKGIIAILPYASVNLISPKYIGISLSTSIGRRVNAKKHKEKHRLFLITSTGIER
jgi:hypothetical protein